MKTELQTEYPFELPRGYLDKEGNLHKKGTMRLATAADEIMPLKDPRVQQNPGYISVILLSRVITKLGSLPALSTSVIENFYTCDLNFMQDMYQRINAIEPMTVKTLCPCCNEQIEVDWPFFGD